MQRDRCDHCGHALARCRRCDAVLNEQNARKARGSFLGICRACERADAAARYEGRKGTNAR